MGATGNVHAGMAVYGPDGQLVGTIDGVPSGAGAAARPPGGA